MSGALVPVWSTACTDWAARLVAGQSIIPAPIFPDTAAHALSIFKRLKVCDIEKVWDGEILNADGTVGAWRHQTFGECSEQWVFDFVAAIFGAYNAETGEQLIREFYLLISKKNTKSTIAAGIMLTAVIICWREGEEHLILAPTKTVADNSFKPAAAMVRADAELSAIFHVKDHVRTIEHRVTKAALKVLAADTDTVAGNKSGRILVDEHWLFGSRADASAMFMEALGGQAARNEGFVIYLTTQSEASPAGVFKEKLDYFRSIRDGLLLNPHALGVLYEFPPDMLKAKAYLQPENWHITNPNLGRSVSKKWLASKLAENLPKTDGSLQEFLAKHLNIQIGMSIRADRWAGADYWQKTILTRDLVSLDYLIERSEVIVCGADGGGLDDLFGFCALGRCAKTGRKLAYFKAWAHEIALERRAEIAPRLRDLQAAGELTIVQLPGEDVAECADMVCKIDKAGLLAEKHALGVDPAGIGDLITELVTGRGMDISRIISISQGWRLNGAIKGAERGLAAREVEHADTGLMEFCVGNAVTETHGNATVVTKAVSGKAKIDPLMAFFNAYSLMALDPEPKKKTYQLFFA